MDDQSASAVDEEDAQYPSDTTRAGFTFQFQYTPSI